MYGGTPAWGTFTPGEGLVRFDLTDAGESVWVRLGRFTGTDPDTGKSHDEDDLAVVEDPGTEPDVVVDGPAAALDAWLWRRRGDDGIAVSGDESVQARFRAIVDQPIN